MPDYPFTVFSILGALSCIEPAISLWRAPVRPWSALFLLSWIFVFNILSFTDSIIWSGENTDEWIDGRGYCDVSSSLKTIFPIGVLASVIGTCRFLLVSIKENILQEENGGRSKLRDILLDIFLSLFIPALFVIFTFLVESSRYVIIGVTGCRGVFDQSWPAIALYFIWPLILALIAAIYTVFVLHRWHLNRKQLNQNWTLQRSNGLSKIQFHRLTIMIVFEVILFLSYSLYTLISLLLTRTDIDFSWDRVHGPDWDIILKLPHPYASWWCWIGIISAVFPVFFIPITSRVKLFFQIRKERKKQGKHISPPIELQASEAVREHWFRFDDEVLDMKNRPSDEIKRDGRPSQSEERKDVNRTVTRISAGRRSLKNFENYWNFGVTVTKQVSVETVPREQIV